MGKYNSSASVADVQAVVAYSYAQCHCGSAGSFTNAAADAGCQLFPGPNDFGCKPDAHHHEESCQEPCCRGNPRCILSHVGQTSRHKLR